MCWEERRGYKCKYQTNSWQARQLTISCPRKIVHHLCIYMITMKRKQLMELIEKLIEQIPWKTTMSFTIKEEWCAWTRGWHIKEGAPRGFQFLQQVEPIRFLDLDYVHEGLFWLLSDGQKPIRWDLWRHSLRKLLWCSLMVVLCWR